MPIIPPTITDQHNGIAVRNGRLCFFDTPEILNVKDLFLSNLSKFRPDTQINGPIRLLTKWCFPLVQGKQNGQWNTSKPDTDNSIKLLKDCMTKAGFWKDDSQVASEITEKFWSSTPGIFIQVTELGKGNQ